VMECLKDLNVCVESCPTSNMRIGMFQDPSEHPLHRFIKAQIPLVIASDDPGLFGVTLKDEQSWVFQYIT
jgi:adenosine deaminase